jgi:hypothetical protein
MYVGTGIKNIGMRLKISKKLRYLRAAPFLNAELQTSFIVKLISFLMAVILPGLVGIYMIIGHYKEIKRIKSSKNELGKKALQADIIKFAEQKEGKLSVVEVMGEFALDEDEVKNAMNSLMAQSIANIELTDSGLIVYKFTDIKLLKDKDNSKDILDV